VTGNHATVRKKDLKIFISNGPLLRRRPPALNERYAGLARDLGEGGTTSGRPRAGPAQDTDLLWDPDRIDDDVLALMFISCHPVLSREARVALARAEQAGRGLGAYGLQAAIAECHAIAPSVGATNWERVVILYEALGRLAPSPVVDLNRAVAVAMAQGPTAALPIVDQLLATSAMPGSHLLPSVRGELLTRLGWIPQWTSITQESWSQAVFPPLGRWRAGT
jgi:predicted RNA polymerase sigma factor